jgi:peptidoglycan/xylan/chitin deacetylase (PgdA/CDA1 family)
MDLAFRTLALAVAVSACGVFPGSSGPLDVQLIAPDNGPVIGGTRVTLTGRGFTRDTVVTIGGFNCGGVTVDGSQQLSCTTESTHFVEGLMDVVATKPDSTATLSDAFTYDCPWTTAAGRRTCGAVPPAAAATEEVESWLTQFEPGHAFVPNPDGLGASSMADASDHVLGDQSAFVETDGRATPRTLARMAMPANDLRGRTFKLWLKVDGIQHVQSLELLAGDSNLSNMFRFKLISHQGQPWITEGAWVAFSIPWSEESYTVFGAPDRAAITDVMLKVIDDGTSRVRLHANAIAFVAEPSAAYPGGVVSFTFDDNYAEMADPGSTILASAGFSATAYVIVDMVDTGGRATLDDLHRLAASGWDIAVHANTDLHHFARYPTLSLDVVENDMVDAREWLIRQGFTGYDHCAYPGGDYNVYGNDVLPLARRYFTSCRTIYQQRELYPPSDASKLRVFYITNVTQLADATLAVDRAAGNGEWLIFVFHRLVTTPPQTSTEWRAADFATLVDHVKQVGIPVKTVNAVLEPQ